VSVERRMRRLAAATGASEVGVGVAFTAGDGRRRSEWWEVTLEWRVRSDREERVLGSSQSSLIGAIRDAEREVRGVLLRRGAEGS